MQILVIAKALGARGRDGSSQPAWAAPTTDLAVVTNTTPENVVDSRALAAATLRPNDVVEAFVLLYIPPGAVAGEKFIRFCVGEAEAASLLEVLDAGVTGNIVVQATLTINTVAPHILRTVVTVNDEAYWNQDRAEVDVAIANALHLETRIWVGDSDDQIVPDAIYLRLNRPGS